MCGALDLSRLEDILCRHSREEGALITVLQEAQEAYGYLPGEVLVTIGKHSHIPLSRIHGVVTFYAQFHLNPQGRHIVRVCRGTACHVRGGRSILNTAKEILGIEEGETAQNLSFSLETVACLGTCFLAPVMMVNRNYYGKLIPPKVASILKQYL